MIKQLNKIQEFIENLNKKNFERFLIISIASITVAVMLITFYIYRTNSKTLQDISNLNNLIKKALVVKSRYQEIQQERNKVIDLLDLEKDFEIKSFFEKFCADHKIRPESDWTTPTEGIEGNSQLEEVSLRATIKDQTTESLTKFLEDLARKTIVYVKELRILKNKSSRTINYEITIATIKSKQSLEE